MAIIYYFLFRKTGRETKLCCDGGIAWKMVHIYTTFGPRCTSNHMHPWSVLDVPPTQLKIHNLAFCVPYQTQNQEAVTFYASRLLICQAYLLSLLPPPQIDCVLSNTSLSFFNMSLPCLVIQSPTGWCRSLCPDVSILGGHAGISGFQEQE